MRMTMDEANIEYKYLIHGGTALQSYAVAHPTLNMFHNEKTIVNGKEIRILKFAEIGDFVSSIINKYIDLKCSDVQNVALKVNEAFVIDDFYDYTQNTDLSAYKQIIDNVLLETHPTSFSAIQKFFAYALTNGIPYFIYSYDTINLPVPDCSGEYKSSVVSDFKKFLSTPVELRGKDDSFFKKYDSKIFKHLIFDNFSSMFEYAIMYLIENNITLKTCENCGKYFYPSSRSDEKYCSNVFKNGKTCRQLGYEIKINNDELLKTYRTAYKTANGWKNRNKLNNKNVEALFVKWHKLAKEQLRQAQNGDIGIDEYKQWFKDNSFRIYVKNKSEV